MGLLDKLKNVFFEEEYVEVEDTLEKPKKIEKIKEKPKEKNTVAKRIETPKRETREVEPEVVQEEIPTEVLSDRELLKPDTSFKLFEDDDFVEEVKAIETKSVVPPIDRKEEKVPYGGTPPIDLSHLYKGEPKEKEFHPTPIISPIYGILDKNYSKEDIVDKKEKRGVSSYARKIDLDSVRKKAYGELSNDLGFVEEGNTSIPVEEKDEIEDNLLYDMSEQDSTPAVEKVTLADAEEYFEDLGLEYNVDYKDKAQEKASGRRVRHTPVIEEREECSSVKETVPNNEESEVEEDQSLEDNLFDLIDSMYEDKE